MTAEMRGVLVVDMGTQYTQLIARRVREAGTWCQIATPDEALNVARGMELGGLILSGGPSSVYDEGAPNPDAELLNLGVPVLGICYGMQWMCQTLGGSVEATDTREYGRTQMTVETAEGLFHGVEGESVVWMSHGDEVTSIPDGFTTHASSESCAFAAVADQARGLWGVQFHPEVSHTVRGSEVLYNFLFAVCQMPGDWSSENIATREIAKVRAMVGEQGEVVLGLSGGVDSAVAAMIMHEAIGSRLHCIFVDNGLLRKGEREVVEEEFRAHLGMDLTTRYVEAAGLTQAGVGHSLAEAREARFLETAAARVARPSLTSALGSRIKGSKT